MNEKEECKHKELGHELSWDNIRTRLKFESFYDRWILKFTVESFRLILLRGLISLFGSNKINFWHWKLERQNFSQAILMLYDKTLITLSSKMKFHISVRFTNIGDASPDLIYFSYLFWRLWVFLMMFCFINFIGNFISCVLVFFQNQLKYTILTWDFWGKKKKKKKTIKAI